MKLVVCLAWVLLAGASAQTVSRQTFTYDLHGRKVDAGVKSAAISPSHAVRYERLESINGRTAPLEAVEEAVIADGPEGRTVERLIRRYEPTGLPGGTEKIRIEERKQPDGSTAVSMVRYASDLNGRLLPVERISSRLAKSGEMETVDARVERLGLNGSFGVVEKRSTSLSRSGNVTESVQVTERPDANGRFREATRVEAQAVTDDRRSTETRVEYNTVVSGRMEPVRRTVSRSAKNEDGSETVVVEVYGAAGAGRPVEGYRGGLQLREQQIIERRPGADATTVETFSVRRTELADANRLGPVQKISETICVGDCSLREH